ncbi:MAG: ComEC/Rec2 family competence protein [Pyrinomonadaceae bacterium]
MPEDAGKTFSRQPLLWLAVWFAFGILTARFVVVDGWVSVAVVVVAAVIAAIVFRGRELATVFVAIAFVATGFLSMQAERQSVRPDRLSVLYDNGTFQSGTPVEVEGVLLGRPEATVQGVILTLRAETLRYRGNDQAVSGNIRLFTLTSQESKISNLRSEILDTGSEISILKYGSRIRVACVLEREDEFLNPGVITRREMLDRMGIDTSGSVKSSLLIEHIADESVFLPLAWVYDQRAKVIDEFRRNLSPKAAGVMIASLLGNKYFLDKDTADLFRDGGTFHILVISGLHITFIGGILLLIMRHLTRNRWVQFSVTVCTLWAYTLAVGADIPVVRAAIMFTVLLFGYVIYRPGSLLNSLGLCGLVLLMWRPSALFDPSFQLTFVSVLAIVACAFPVIEHLRSIGTWTPSAERPFPPNVPTWLKRFCETLYWRPEVWPIEAKRQIWIANIFKSPLYPDRVKGLLQKGIRYIFEGLLVSAIVQIWMLPLSVVYFHRVSISSVLLNLWVSFFIAVESFAAVAGVIAGNVSTLLATGFYAIADTMNWLMLLLPRLLSDGGWASFRIPAYESLGFAVYVVYLVPVLFFAVAATIWRVFVVGKQSSLIGRRLFVSACAILILLTGITVFHPFSRASADGRMHVDFLDVGQGDAALVTFPDGRMMLIDGGGKVNYDAKADEAEPVERDVRGVGEAVVSEVLWAKGLSHIDVIVATHADADHIQGLTDVARNFSVGTAIFGRTPRDDPDFAQLEEVLRRHGVRTEVVSRGDLMRFGEATVEVLYPLASGDPEAVSDNDHSVVLRIVYGSRTFLFTGDIERSAETELTSLGGTLAADVVKVPHHGSRTSSTQSLIDAVRPQYAVISVGRRSLHGHPHQDVVDRWKTAGANVLTTGERGMISVSTDGRDFLITRFLDK